MDRTSLDMLSGILWRERDLLEHVGDLVDRDAEATDLALRSLSSLELHRAILTREVAAEHAIAGEPSLVDLIDGVPGEWGAVLAGHRRALRELAARVKDRLVAVELPVRVEGNGGATQPGLRTRAAVQRSLVDFLA